MRCELSERPPASLLRDCLLRARPCALDGLAFAAPGRSPPREGRHAAAANIAWALETRAPESQVARFPTKIDAKGVIRVYDPATNRFGAFNPNGTTRTFSRQAAGNAPASKKGATVTADNPAAGSAKTKGKKGEQLAAHPSAEQAPDALQQQRTLRGKQRAAKSHEEAAPQAVQPAMPAAEEAKPAVNAALNAVQAPAAAWRF